MKGIHAVISLFYKLLNNCRSALAGVLGCVRSNMVKTQNFTIFLSIDRITYFINRKSFNLLPE